mmetsp:Transcript_24538/g.48137  ORF Transcript_24538/g.48137 Transcript_24538/m.48137 type:complete len:156 (+) Transcript_24538:1320-1787(+)
MPKSRAPSMTGSTRRETPLTFQNQLLLSSHVSSKPFWLFPDNVFDSMVASVCLKKGMEKPICSTDLDLAGGLLKDECSRTVQQFEGGAKQITHKRSAQAGNLISFLLTPDDTQAEFMLCERLHNEAGYATKESLSQERRAQSDNVELDAVESVKL